MFGDDQALRFQKCKGLPSGHPCNRIPFHELSFRRNPVALAQNAAGNLSAQVVGDLLENGTI
ncbi:hypothetical protein GCM10011575_44020 [Microlunatus endophyticus]|uniref:Uncharacterized protein n=1 Tax=Microlunatus endophyticus TaxID=1716077 RepID=A0A917W7S8_9ACTN|nr:hypothetical protein GCM10011575_44020 [Microlunatus endophyticus]